MSDPTPLFSIVMPTFNRSRLIENSIAACSAQSCQDFELIVVDDGSSDDTVDVLRALGEPRLRVLTQTNQGPAAARNHGVREARGQYIAFLDSDDEWLEDYLETVVAALAAQTPFEDPARLCFYSRLIIDRGVERFWVKPARGLAPNEAIHDYLYVHGGFIQSSTLVLPAALARSVLWDENITFGDNDQFAIDCWHAGAQWRMLPRAMTRYADAMSSDALSQLPIHAADSPRYRNFFEWMERQKNHMSPRAWCGFEARFRSVALARETPSVSVRLVFRAYRQGALGLSGAARQLLQNFTPRFYRWLTDRYVSQFGLTLDQARAR